MFWKKKVNNHDEMAEGDLRRLGRADLIEIIYQLQKEPDADVGILSKEQVQGEREKLRAGREYRRTIIRVLEVLVVTAAVSVLLATMFFPVLSVSGVSMEPTLENGQVIVLEKTSKFKTGDLIAFYYQNKILLKRVIGNAGDNIDIDEEGNVYVNEVKLDEPYLKEKALGECDITFPYQVPDGKIFVMGDHRSKSIDSRSKLVGCVSEEQVVGKVALRLWPLNRIGFLK